MLGPEALRVRWSSVWDLLLDNTTLLLLLLLLLAVVLVLVLGFDALRVRGPRSEVPESGDPRS